MAGWVLQTLTPATRAIPWNLELMPPVPPYIDQSCAIAQRWRIASLPFRWQSYTAMQPHVLVVPGEHLDSSLAYREYLQLRPTSCWTQVDQVDGDVSIRASPPQCCLYGMMSRITRYQEL